MYGYSTRRGIRKVNNKVEFDTVINTPKGTLFCNYLRSKKEKY